MDFSTFFVQQVIIHDVPQAKTHEKDAQSVELSDLPCDLTQDKKNHFRERITEAFKKRQLQVVYADGGNSKVPSLLKSFFDSDGANFVEVSKQLAAILYRAQPGVANAGKLVVIEGAVGSGANIGKCLAILKLEMDDAVTLAVEGPKGQRRFSVTVRQIALSKSAPVFKAFLVNRFDDLANLQAIVSDNQAEPSRFGEEVASYFLSFLGCTPPNTADRQTESFVVKTENFLNSGAIDSSRRLPMTTALFAELQSQEKNIDIPAFAKKYLEPAERDGFLNLFRSEDGSISSIPKENSRVEKLMAARQIEFKNGLKLIGPTELIEALDSFGGKTVIQSEIAEVKSRRRA